MDILRPDQAEIPITIVGAGGVGSLTATVLAKMGVSDITVYDFDTVESENLASQIYGSIDQGKPKVDALADVVTRLSDATIKAVNARWEDQPLEGLVIAAADCMDVRKRIWEAVKLNPAAELLIDCRMGGMVMHLLSARPCDPDDIAHYEQFLFTNEEASPQPCGARAIAFNTFGIASMVGAMVRKWLTGDDVPRRLVGDFNTLSFMALPQIQE